MVSDVFAVRLLLVVLMVLTLLLLLLPAARRRQRALHAPHIANAASAVAVVCCHGLRSQQCIVLPLC